MRLITHNWLLCNKKGVVNGYPLSIEADSIEVEETEFNPEFMKKILPKLEWPVVVTAPTAIGHGEGLPAELTEQLFDDEEFLKLAHRVLMDIHVKEGNLVCPESGRKFPIKEGIPNMLLN